MALSGSVFTFVLVFIVALWFALEWRATRKRKAEQLRMAQRFAVREFMMSQMPLSDAEYRARRERLKKEKQ